MNFEQTEEQGMLSDSIRRFVQDRYDLEKRRSYLMEPVGFSMENWRALAELGVTGLPIPETAGGYGGSLADLMAVMEALGRGLVVEPVLTNIVMSAALLARCGPANIAARHLPAVTAGTLQLALAHAEPGSRFGDGGDGLHYVDRGGQGTLTGAKTFVLNAAAADAFIVTVGRGDAMSMLLIPANRPGLSRRDYRVVDGSIASDLHFDGVAVEPADHLDGGAEAWSDGIALASIAACAEMLGIMGRLFDETLDYLKTRRQFGVPIGSFQVLQHRMARLYISMEQARSLLLRAVLTSQEERQGWRRSAMAAKAFFADAAMRLAEECVQFHGGMGVTDELIVGHGMKRLMLLTRLFGDGASAREAYEALAA